MAKFNKELTEKIVLLIEEDNYTITEICRIVGISRKMFYQWRGTKPAFAAALNEAIEAREEKLRQKARKSMRQKLEGYKQIETKTTYVASEDSDNPNALTVKQYVVKEKYCIPETSAIVYSLSGDDNVYKGKRAKPQAANPLVITLDAQKTKQDIERLQTGMVGNAG